MSIDWQSKTFTVSVPANTANHADDTSFGPSLFNILKIKVTQDSPGGTFNLRVFKDAAHAKRLINIPLEVAPLYQPRDRTTGDPGTEAFEGRPFPYDDEDATGQLHTQWDNNDSVDHVYTITVIYYELPLMSAAGGPTFRGAMAAQATGGIGAVSSDGFVLANATAAAAGAQQWSARMRFTGQGWKTNSTAASQPIDFIVENQTVQGAANPSGNLVISAQVNGGGYTGWYSFSSAGAFLQSAAYAIGATSTDGHVLANTTPAISGGQQWSPRLRLTGQGWKTTATAASQAVDWIIENQPVQGSANPSSNLVISSQINAGGYSTLFTLTSAGLLSGPTWNGAAIGAAYGGTGLATYAVGDLIYASAVTPTLARLADVAVGSVLVSGGVNTAPAWSTTPQIARLGIGAAADASIPLLLTTTNATAASFSYTGSAANAIANLLDSSGSSSTGRAALVVNSKAAVGSAIKFNQAGSVTWVAGSGAASDGTDFELYASAAGNFGLQITTAGSVKFAGTGPHAVGGATNVQWQWLQTGTYANAGYTGGLGLTSTLQPSAGNQSDGLYIAPTIQKAGSGTHSALTGGRVALPAISGSGNSTDSVAWDIATFSISGGTNATASGLRVAAPTGATTNYAINVTSGNSLLQTFQAVRAGFGIAADGTILALLSGSGFSQNAPALNVRNSATGPAHLYTETNTRTEASVFGTDQSAGGGLLSGSSAYATVVGSVSNRPLQFGTNNTVVGQFGITGGFIVGAPTGADKGAGTINIAGDIYKNNTAYTFPDYALEMWATGKIVKFANNFGADRYKAFTLAEVRAFAAQNYYLPQLDFYGAHDEGAGIFDRSDIALTLHEDTFRYLWQHDDQIDALNTRLQRLEQARAN